jgi:hypothetical protein
MTSRTYNWLVPIRLFLITWVHPSEIISDWLKLQILSGYKMLSRVTYVQFSSKPHCHKGQDYMTWNRIALVLTEGSAKTRNSTIYVLKKRNVKSTALEVVKG